MHARISWLIKAMLKVRAVIAYGVAISLSLQYKQVVSLVNDICTFALNVEFPLGQESFQPATSGWPSIEALHKLFCILCCKFQVLFASVIVSLSIHGRSMPKVK
jgi:hypothetical protein